MLHVGRIARWAATQVSVTFGVFDLLHLDGEHVCARPLVERNRALDDLKLLGPAWVVNGWYEGDKEIVFQVAEQLGHEGVVANRLDSHCRPGRRTRSWLRRKTSEWRRIHGPRRLPREALRR
jgi:bifunctional non-homologous end joining protein LigD